MGSAGLMGFPGKNTPKEEQPKAKEGLTVTYTTPQVIESLEYWAKAGLQGAGVAQQVTLPLSSVLHAIRKLKQQMNWVEELKEELRAHGQS